MPGGPLPLLLPDSPNARTDINTPATASERMKLDGTMYGFKVGPFFELPVSSDVALRLQGGFAALLVDGKLDWNESISSGAFSHGTAKNSQWRYGGYVEGEVSVAISRSVSLAVGVGWQDLSGYSVQAGSKAAKLKLDNVYTAFIGLNYLF